MHLQEQRRPHALGQRLPVPMIAGSLPLPRPLFAIVFGGHLDRKREGTFFDVTPTAPGPPLEARWPPNDWKRRLKSATLATGSPLGT
jgi:hypothetical protein